MALLERLKAALRTLEAILVENRHIEVFAAFWNHATRKRQTHTTQFFEPCHIGFKS